MGQSRLGGPSKEEGMIPAGTVAFHSDDSPDAIADARAYIRRMGFTRDDCRLVKRAGQTMVILERNIGEN